METGTSKPKLATILLIIALMASSLIAIQAYTEDSIPKPAVPEFTVKIVAYPYDIPPETITHINEYTGETTVTNKPGKHIENKSIEITIKNPPFTPYTITTHTGYNHETGESYTYDRNNTVNLFYDVGVKGHYGDKWKSVETLYTSYWEGPQSNAQLDSEYTVITIAADYPNDAFLDFRVQARVGYFVAYGRTVVIFGL
jgi:hypothetical protein